MKDAPAPAPRSIVLLHGILLNRWFLHPLERHFRGRGHRVLNLSYRSTRHTIEEHAEAIAGRVESWRARHDPPTIDFVTHSLGGLIARRILTRHPIAEARRLLMMVPPSQGSSLARRLGRLRLYRALWGKHAGRQLALSGDEIEGICGVPDGIEMGIIAGVTPWRRSLFHGGGAHDGIVTLEEARLPGVPLIGMPSSHTLILLSPRAWRQAAGFIEEGRFRSPSAADGR